jgi:hypothetical protein
VALPSQEITTPASPGAPPGARGEWPPAQLHSGFALSCPGTGKKPQHREQQPNGLIEDIFNEL